jgi:hypothetical protein
MQRGNFMSLAKLIMFLVALDCTSRLWQVHELLCLLKATPREYTLHMRNGQARAPRDSLMHSITHCRLATSRTCCSLPSPYL